MHREKTFFQKNYNRIVILISMIPSLIVVAFTGSYAEANTNCSVPTVAIASFILVLLSTLNIFNILNFMKKRTLVAFVILGIVTLLMIFPTIHYVLNIGNLAGGISMTAAKYRSIIVFVFSQIVVIIAVIMAAFKIDLNKKHRDLD